MSKSTIRQASLNIFLIAFVSALISNIFGYWLISNELDEYIIIAGFRIYVILLIPTSSIVLFKLSVFDKNYFFGELNSGLLKIILSVFGVYAAALIIVFLITETSINEPEYMYEFGATSIIDFPIYFVWNAPNIFCVYIMGRTFKHKECSILITVLFFLFHFFYKLYPFNFEMTNGHEYAFFLFILLTLIVFAYRLGNVFEYGALIFTTMWLFIYLFGSDSKTLINLLFAKNYDSWEGFIKFNENEEWIKSVILLFLFLFFNIFYFRLKTRKYK